MLAPVHPEPRDRETLPVCLGGENPNRLVSLWDIVNRFKAAEFCTRIGNLSVLHRDILSVGVEDCEAWNQIGLEVGAQILHAARNCNQIGLTHAFEEIDRVNSGLAERLNDRDAHRNALRHVRKCLLDELSKRNFLFVAEDRTNFVDNPSLFGGPVREAFPSASSDIQEAGNCLAAECNTAAVFHLMRASEHALRALAWDRRVALPKKGIIDLATWEEIIREMERAEHVIQTYPKTLAREVQYDFYHGAMMEFRRFKNKFRNGIMHTRDEYDRNEAQSAFEHVRSFFQILASRISEQRRTPMVWRGKKWLTIQS